MKINQQLVLTLLGMYSICFVYVSQKNSTFNVRTNTSSNLLDHLESDLCKYSQLGDIMFMGDFNSHINHKDLDFIEEDDVLDVLPNAYPADIVHTYRNLENCLKKTDTYGKAGFGLMYFNTV